MKKIIVKVLLLQENTYEISINENIISKEVILNYTNNPKFEDYIYETENNLNFEDAPKELKYYDYAFEQMGVNEENNPYLNLAKMIAYTKAKYNLEVIEGLIPVENLNPNAKGISISTYEDDHNEVRYDFDWNESSMIKSSDDNFLDKSVW